LIGYFQAEKSKIKLDDVEFKANAEILIKSHEGLQETIIQEEIIGQAKAEMAASDEEAETYRKKMGDMFCSTVVRLKLMNE
jgi:hypothetical protein